MNPTVIDEISTNNFVAEKFEQVADRLPKYNVTHMSQVEWFIGIGRAELHHNFLFEFLLAVL